MSCKICSYNFHYCSSCDQITEYDYSVCKVCWKKYGLDVKYEQLEEAKEKLEDAFIAEIDKIKNGN